MKFKRDVLHLSASSKGAEGRVPFSGEIQHGARSSFSSDPVTI